MVFKSDESSGDGENRIFSGNFGSFALAGAAKNDQSLLDQTKIVDMKGLSDSQGNSSC